MFIIRPTASLAKKIRMQLEPIVERSYTVLGDWYAIDITLSRKPYILCVSEASRLAVLIKAAPYFNFQDRLEDTLAHLLKSFDISEQKTQQELSKMVVPKFAKTINKSILGSLNDYKHALKVNDQLGRFAEDKLFEVNLWLADYISLRLEEGTPERTVMKLFAASNNLPRLRLIKS